MCQSIDKRYPCPLSHAFFIGSWCEEEAMGKLTNQVSPTLSWPLASRHPRGSLSGSSHNRLKKRLKLEARRRFMFDSMCGIPGPSSSMDYQLLRYIVHNGQSKTHQSLTFEV